MAEHPTSQEFQAEATTAALLEIAGELLADLPPFTHTRMC